MILSLAILFHFQLIAANAQTVLFEAFVEPPAALKNSRYVDDCGGVSEDLSDSMPPVDSQNPSNWCATFATRSLIELLIHQSDPNDAYKNRISPVDLNAWNTSKPAELRGKFFGMDQGTDPYLVLEGAQLNASLYAEQDLPFDQNFFDKSNILQRLANYYDEEKPFADQNAMSCRNQSPDDKSLEAQFASLTSVLIQSSAKSSFLDALDQQYSIADNPKPGATRATITPAFDIRRVQATTADQEMEEWQNNLRAKTPTVIDICADQLMQDPTYLDHLVPPPFTNSCGAHALVVVGMKKIGNTCQVKLRNSWGDTWPSAGDKGYVWIPAKQLLAIMDMHDGASFLTSISKRSASDPVKNTIITPEFRYQGETQGEKMEGNGHLEHADGSIEEGQFKNGLLHIGTFKGTFSTGVSYSGAIEDGQPKGQGHMVLKNGAIMDGIFGNGILLSGTYSGIINDATGECYDGPMVNGYTTSQGRFYYPNQNH